VLTFFHDVFSNFVTHLLWTEGHQLQILKVFHPRGLVAWQKLSNMDKFDKISQL
jgi:hypothetical protein